MISQIRMDQKNCIRVEEPFSFNILGRSASNLDGQFLSSRLLVDALLRMESNERDKQELVQLFKDYYDGKGSFEKNIISCFCKKVELICFDII